LDDGWFVQGTIPGFQVFVDVVADAVLAMPSSLEQGPPDDSRPSITDFVVKACALALRQHPRANASYCDDNIELHSRINIDIAVALADSLVVPIMNADTKPLNPDRSRGLNPTTSRSSGRDHPSRPVKRNLYWFGIWGMFGATAVIPIINPFQGAILGVGGTPGVVSLADGEVPVQQWMALSLVCDHRILRGAGPARLLSGI
jgi:pyruvate dehydrogenase E2 component (dihydrolipoamide acetyltransferase)